MMYPAAHAAAGTFVFWAALVLLWLVLLALIVFLVVRLVRPPAGPGRPPLAASGSAETPEQICDRLFATGEIDEQTYRARRTVLAQMRAPQ